MTRRLPFTMQSQKERTKMSHTIDPDGINAGHLRAFVERIERLDEEKKARVEELLSAAAEKAGVTISRIVDELAKIAFANAVRAADEARKRGRK